MNLVKNKTQTAVINIVNKRILMNLTFRALVNIHFSSYIDGSTSAVVKFSAKFDRKLFSQNLVRSILLETFPLNITKF